MSDAAGDALLLAGAVLAPLALGLLLRAVARRGGGGKPSWPRLAAGNALVAALLASLGFLAGECWYRWVHDEPDGFALTRTAARWERRHVRLNRAGVRDDVEYRLVPAPGTRRLLVVGDSFTVGQGVPVERRFANLLRDALAPEWEVHLLARNGWSTVTQVDALRRLPPGHRADAVLLVYNLNDTAELIPAWREILAAVYRRRGREGFLLRHSFLVNTLFYRRFLQRTPELRRYYDLLAASYEEGPVLEELRRQLDAFSAAAGQRGLPLLAVTFPLLHLLGDYPFAGAHEAVAAHWRRAGVPHLDLLPAFEGVSAAEVVVSRWDSHPDEEGHRRAAEAMLPFLLRELPGAFPAP